MTAKKGNPGYHPQRGKSALHRFAEKCAFDPFTGCVMWEGGQTSGRGHSAPYGSFWDGRRWFAHRWAAVHIHGLDIDGLQADHCCPAGPHTLCVEHVQPLTLHENLELQHSRPGRPIQNNAQRQFWLFVSKGIEPPPEPPERVEGDIPYFEPPEWLKPFLPTLELEECPF